jgi:hypothetical protein
MKVIKIITGVAVFLGAQVIAATIVNYKNNREIDNMNKKSE